MTKPVSELSVSYRGRRPKQEGPRHIQAYRYYEGLGSQRSLSKVAQDCKYSISAVKAWSSAFAWQSRIRKKEKEADPLVLEKGNEIFEIRKALITLARLLITDALRKAAPVERSLEQAVENNKMIELTSTKDIKDLVGIFLAVVNWGSDSIPDLLPEENPQRTSNSISIE